MFDYDFILSYSTRILSHKYYMGDMHDIRECSALLHDIVLEEYSADRWMWLLDPMLGYSVKGTYHFLTLADEPPARGLFDNE